jgi:hypothetical protein
MLRAPVLFRLLRGREDLVNPTAHLGFASALLSYLSDELRGKDLQHASLYAVFSVLPLECTVFIPTLNRCFVDFSGSLLFPDGLGLALMMQDGL